MNITCLQDQEMSNQTFIFIDGSYFCFYRYHSLLTWWKNAYPEEIDVLQDPYQNEQFIEKFKKTFVDNIQKIPKGLKLDKGVNPIIIENADSLSVEQFREKYETKKIPVIIKGVQTNWKANKNWTFDVTKQPLNIEIIL